MSHDAVPASQLRRALPPKFVRNGWIALGVGLALLALAYLVDGRRAAFDNVILFMFMASLAGGAIFLVALEYIAGAVWSVPVRRINEFLAALTPLTPFLALPLFFHLHDLFHWTHAETVAADHLLQAKSPYLNIPFFIVRFVLVFGVWTVFYVLFTRNSTRQDITKDSKLTVWNIRLAAGFLPLFAVGLTVIAIDWAMSLEPHWYSTIFGVYYFAGTAVAAVSAAALIIVLMQEHGYLTVLRRDHLYSLGALMFAFVNFWAYIAFSQFLLIWYANLPEETFWFMARWQHGWQYVSVLLIVVQFAVPYFALLSQNAKMDPKRLKFIAIWILAAHLLDIYWLVMPTYDESVALGWYELAIPLVAIGLVVVVFSYLMPRRNLMPVGDPKLIRGLNFHL